MATATASKTKTKVSPLADRVVIKPLEETETMKGGLYIPDTAKEKPIQGEVTAVGPGRREKGETVPMELNGCEVPGVQRRGPCPPEARRGQTGRRGQGHAGTQRSQRGHRQEIR